MFKQTDDSDEVVFVLALISEEREERINKKNTRLWVHDINKSTDTFIHLMDQKQNIDIDQYKNPKQNTKKTLVTEFCNIAPRCGTNVRNGLFNIGVLRLNSHYK